MKFFKRICTAIASSILVLGFTTNVFAYDKERPILIHFNGNEVMFEKGLEPARENNSIYAPYDILFKGLGCEYQYDSNTKVIAVVKGDTKVSFKVGNTGYEAIKNGEAKSISTKNPTIEKNGTILVCVRDACEALGNRVNWDDFNKVVLVFDRDKLIGDDTYEVMNGLVEYLYELPKEKPYFSGNINADISNSFKDELDKNYNINLDINTKLETKKLTFNLDGGADFSDLLKDGSYDDDYYKRIAKIFESFYVNLVLDSNAKELLFNSNLLDEYFITSSIKDYEWIRLDIREYVDEIMDYVRSNNIDLDKPITVDRAINLYVDDIIDTETYFIAEIMVERLEEYKAIASDKNFVKEGNNYRAKHEYKDEYVSGEYLDIKPKNINKVTFDMLIKTDGEKTNGFEIKFNEANSYGSESTSNENYYFNLDIDKINAECSYESDYDTYKIKGDFKFQEKPDKALKIPTDKNKIINYEDLD